LLELLRKIFRYGHHEILLTTIDINNNPNTAPMGVKLSNNFLIIEPYTSTDTYSNIARGSDLVINVTSDSILYYSSLLRPEKLNYSKARHVNSFIINGNIDMYIEGRVMKIENISSIRARVVIDPIDIYEGEGSNAAYSRANNALIEALVYYTKLQPLIIQGQHHQVMETYQRIKDLVALINRLGSSELKEAARTVLAKATNITSKLQKQCRYKD
jgi:hypothetical protein